MSVALRFKRIGKPKNPQYRLVAIDRREPAGGCPLEVLGHYNPKVGTKSVQVNVDRFRYWLDRGAQPSDSVRGLLRSAGLWRKVSPSKNPS